MMAEPNFSTISGKKRLEGILMSFTAVFFHLLLLGSVQQADSFVLNSTQPSAPLRVALFNIRSFGKTKMSRPETVKNLVRIMKRYDVVFVMETRDAGMTSLTQLRTALGYTQWNYTASIPIGRSTYKEQYVYWYRPAAVKLLQASVYDDDAWDNFEREPYMAQFQYWSHSARSEIKVTLVGIHIKPAVVVEELEHLPKVISSAKKVFPDSDGIVVMGDFNADCRYMNDVERSEPSLLNTPTKYISYVGDAADTTVSHNTDCAYDRLVVPSQGQPEVKVANVKVFDFEKALGLSFEAAHDVSDHYPVEFTLE
ncbi:deoxyribonuclease [Elysia marginata]|uniref:Deoxyribonuclease n=1 Tax=Elysia marginata TaxID=1093978 RepID=A0AAV4EE09_9GAST|nr:deoxyribonuclease [Elysia marginata]